MISSKTGCLVSLKVEPKQKRWVLLNILSRTSIPNLQQQIELLSWMSRTALELVGQAGLGYSFDTLEDDAAAHPYTGVLKQLLSVEILALI